MPSTTEKPFIPKRNNFENLPEYYLQCSIIKSLATYRDANGFSPSIVRSIITDLLRYNDNTHNPVIVY
jgi:transcription initiation factor TFIID subunit 2